MEFLAISSTNLVLWVFAALFAGYYVDTYDKRQVSGGVVLTSVFSIIGALMAGYLMSFITGKALLGFNFEALLVTLIAAAVFAFFYRFSFRKSQRRHIVVRRKDGASRR